ncbi:hypothetical protein RHECNPAF_430039 [Rhizobium etli CNPAF512]|nr:hypothetical protein RHECNPAF_430039 [Rhizobium etli CNPAF512]
MRIYRFCARPSQQGISLSAQHFFSDAAIITVALRQPIPQKAEDPPGWMTGPLVGLLAQCVAMIALNLDIVTAY